MSSNRGASSTVEVAADKTLSRRRYFREKQREYRRKFYADGVIVKAQFEHLQSILDGLQASMPPPPREASDGPLSWHSIATVFKREAHRVLTDRQSLVSQTQEYQSLTNAMQRFVTMNIPPPMSRSNVWHSATLVADARARNLGKEWLTQQLYHNIHEPFTLLPAVSYDDQDDFVQFDFQASDQPFTCIEQMQYTWPGTVQMFRRLVESNMQAVIFHNHVEMVVEEKTANTRLFHTTSRKGSFINWLQGHFVEANRFILVMRQVEHDEAHVCDPVQKHQHYMSWTEVRQVSPTHILLRFVSHISHLFRGNDGFVSVDEIAAVRDIDITGIQDEDHKVAYVRREVFRRGKADLLSWRQHFMDLMHQTAIN